MVHCNLHGGRESGAWTVSLSILDCNGFPAWICFKFGRIVHFRKLDKMGQWLGGYLLSKVRILLLQNFEVLPLQKRSINRNSGLWKLCKSVSCSRRCYPESWKSRILACSPWCTFPYILCLAKLAKSRAFLRDSEDVL